MRRLMSYFVAHRTIKYTNYFEIANFWRYLSYLIGSRRYVIDAFCEKYVKYRALFCLKKMKSEYCIFQ